MSYSPWDLHDCVEEQLTSIGFLPPDAEHSNEDIRAAFYQLVEQHQSAMKLLTAVINSYETRDYDGCGTIDKSVNQSIVKFIHPEDV